MLIDKNSIFCGIKNPSHQTSRHRVKAMLLHGLTWHRLRKSLFINKKVLYVKYENYRKPCMPSHTSNLIQDFLKETIPPTLLHQKRPIASVITRQ